MSDWEQYLEKQDHKARLARKVFFRLIFCILLAFIVVKAIALIPESKPENNEYPSSNEYREHSGTSTIHFTSDSSEDSILLFPDSKEDSILLIFDNGGLEITVEENN